MGVERRKYIRFLVQDKTIAALEGVIDKVGKVNDIGIKGLSFMYLGESIETGSGSDSYRVDIFHKKKWVLSYQCALQGRIWHSGPYIWQKS